MPIICIYRAEVGNSSEEKSRSEWERLWAKAHLDLSFRERKKRENPGRRMYFKLDAFRFGADTTTEKKKKRERERENRNGRKSFIIFLL